MSNPRGAVKAVIFDMDGLLLDSECLYTKITDEILAPYNKQLTWEIKSLIMGRPALESAAILISRTGIPVSPSELVAAMSERQKTLFPFVQPMPGAVRLATHLSKHQIPIAIATGSIQHNFDLKSMNLPQLFSPFQGRVVCGDDPELKRGKPNPDPFLLAARRHLGLTIDPDPATGFLDLPPRGNEQVFDGIRPDEILVLEDGLPGVRSAKAAGMRVVWVPPPELTKVSIAPGDDNLAPDQVLGSLTEWDGTVWGLPALS